MPQRPHDLGVPVQDGSLLTPLLEAKTESFLFNLVEPQRGQGVPSHFEDRTRTSLSFPHFSQWNSYIGIALR